MEMPRANASGPHSAATAAHAAPAAAVPTLFGRYRLVLLLECGPSLLATLQPGSARILSAMLGAACRKVLAKIAHAATKVGRRQHATTAQPNDCTCSAVFSLCTRDDRCNLSLV